MSFQFPPNAVSSAGFSRAEGLITPEQLKLRYLFGIDMTDVKGNPIPDEVYQHHINAAVSYIEHKLDVVIFPTEIVDKHDYRAVDYQEFNFLQLKKRPVKEVTTLKAKFPNNRELVNFPPEWFVVEKEAAQVQLAPVQGTFNSLVITQGGSYVPIIFGSKDHWPHMFEVTYTAGFCNDQIPVILNEMIGLQASISLFEMLGDITLGTPIASENVNMDGAGVGKATTASSNSGLYSARIESYRKKLEEYIKVAHKYYNGFAFTVP
jgi:hypothetical protein